MCSCSQTASGWLAFNRASRMAIGRDLCSPPVWSGKLWSMAMCSCSQTAARRSWDSALCATLRVLVLGKKTRENANVLTIAVSLTAECRSSGRLRPERRQGVGASHLLTICIGPAAALTHSPAFPSSGFHQVRHSEALYNHDRHDNYIVYASVFLPQPAHTYRPQGKNVASNCEQYLCAASIMPARKPHSLNGVPLREWSSI